MSNDNDTLDTLPAPAAPEAPDADGDDGAEDDGPEESEAAAGASSRARSRSRPCTRSAGHGPTSPPPAQAGRGAPVLFTPEGQAYRMLTGPDGQQNQVFLTPQELQQWQARQQQQQQPPQPGQQAPGAGPRPPPAQVQSNLAPVEGVLDTEAKGPNAFLRQIRRNLLPGPEDAEIPKNLVQKLRLRQGQYLTAMAQMRGQKGLVQRVDTVDGARWTARRGCRTSMI